MKNKVKLCNCKGYIRFKIVHTHGEKSRGYKVCKECGGVIR